MSSYKTKFSSISQESNGFGAEQTAEIHKVSAGLSICTSYSISEEFIGCWRKGRLPLMVYHLASRCFAFVPDERAISSLSVSREDGCFSASSLLEAQMFRHLLLGRRTTNQCNKHITSSQKRSQTFLDLEICKVPTHSWCTQCATSELGEWRVVVETECQLCGKHDLKGRSTE